MLSFDPFSQSQFGLKMPCCTEGERARNQERVCLLEGEAERTRGQIHEIWRKSGRQG